MIHPSTNPTDEMTRRNKAGRVSKMIEEMMDIKLREHDRKHHFKGDDEEFPAEMNRSMADQNKLRGIQANLAGAIADLSTAD